MNKIFAIFLFSLTSVGFAQQNFKIQVFDSESKETLLGAKVILKNSSIGSITNTNGIAEIAEIPEGEQVFVISFIGYLESEVSIPFPYKGPEPYSVYLQVNETELDEIIIEATRANKTVANLPTRTEVLTEEIDEAASMEASKIAHLITHSTGIQVQTTSASSNGAVVRIQGLNGRYTQILKDGFPLYGGFSGSLDILQIPPLDLRQVEYIKGSASTLYGGGAIGGLINLLSKRPEKEETLLHINVSHIGAKDFNAFASRKFGKFGFTNLATFHLQSVYDADGDGYSDIPEVAKFNFNPKLYFWPDKKTEIYLGATISKDERMGGDIDLINNEAIDVTNFYYDRQKSSRYTTQFSANREFTKASTLTLKNSFSLFDRFIEIRQDPFGTLAQFAGQQMNTFSELNYNLNKTKHNLTVGLNVYTDEFTEKPLDTVAQVRNQQYLTSGIFVNHLWDISKKFALETGLRGDYVIAKSRVSKNNGEPFILPRMSALWKVSKNISLRLGGGMGYRMPTIFNEEAEPFGYKNVQAIDFDGLKAERSYGGNFDFKYNSTFGSENILFTFNQMFFYNLIDNPILLNPNFAGNLVYSNYGESVISRGFESQIKLTLWQFTWFFGYTFTDAYLDIFNTENRLTLTPEHSIKGDLLFVIEDKWRIGWDYEYKSSQLIYNGTQSTRSLFTTGIVVERTLKNFVIFLNAENFKDVRQTKYESIQTGLYNTPQFTDIWAPLDGFFFNGGLKIKL